MSQSNFIELVTAAFEAGESRTFIVSGQYFELIDAPGPVDVLLVDRFGAQRGVMRAAEASFNLRATDFNEVQIISPSAQSIRFAYGTGEAGTRRSAGQVQVSGAINVTSIANPVQVAELAYLRELNNRYGVGHQFFPATAGQNHRYILSNPQGSGKTLKVETSNAGLVNAVATAVMRAYICNSPASGAATKTPIKYNPASLDNSVASLVLVQNKGTTAGAGLVAGYTVLQELDLITSGAARPSVVPPEVFIPEGCSLVFDIDSVPTTGMDCSARWVEI